MEKAIRKELDEIKSLVQNNVKKEWYTIKDLSAFTSISESTIRRAIKHHTLRYLKTSGRLLFNIDWIEEWLRGKK